jgi:two-component system response regulator RegA
MDDCAVRTVLLVDDDERVLGAFQRGLPRDWRVTTARDVRDAAQIASREYFELAILDLHIGDTSAIPLIRDLKAKQPGLRIALMSGYLTTDSIVVALRAGADVVVDKPITPREILRRCDAGLPVDIDLEETPTIEDAIDAHVARVKTDCGENISETARRLGIHRTSLQRRLRRMSPAR